MRDTKLRGSFVAVTLAKKNINQQRNRIQVAFRRIKRLTLWQKPQEKCLHRDGKIIILHFYITISFTIFE
jgi:hypothetical protein